MFRIKICGVKTLDDAREAVRVGADAIGLNFYNGSPRCLTVLQAKGLAEAIPNPVGVFVNATADEINRIATEVGLSWVQLHGDEPPELLAGIHGKFKIIRAIRFDQRGVEPIAAYIEACRKAGREPEAVLVDAAASGQYGGTGETVRWTDLSNYPKWLSNMPLVLAGGLTPENVAESIRTVRPYGVDVASGVEGSPGMKDQAKMQAFVEAAREAFTARH